MKTIFKRQEQNFNGWQIESDFLERVVLRLPAVGLHDMIDERQIECVLLAAEIENDIDENGFSNCPVIKDEITSICMAVFVRGENNAKEHCHRHFRFVELEKMNNCLTMAYSAIESGEFFTDHEHPFYGMKIVHAQLWLETCQQEKPPPEDI